MNPTVLIIEDEKRLREIVKEYFENDQFTVIEAEDGEQGIKKFIENQVDLIILDLMLPKLDGWEVCKLIREQSSIPIIMTTARSEEEDQLLGFDIGTDEYVTKPFSPKILVAKAKSVLRRTADPKEDDKETKTICGIMINTSSRTASINNEILQLTNKEFELLCYLIDNKGIVLTRDQLLNNIWGFDYFGDGRTVDTHIKKLRHKLGDKAKHIATVIRVGYKFEE
ncbi:response regulator transcription factor [Bacillus sp. AFS053548]|uniref:response regulator transcription factor n=1 Tax=Bacillus sp. AFS053548 TaxID=2033505 RepID=UPI000BFE3DAD|nr:response regulator transcription factor [Bacillus sp. AFS053548]PGM57484.1 DNA-binding response regulator [Bacillus sp. AFS053548]